MTTFLNLFYLFRTIKIQVVMNIRRATLKDIDIIQEIEKNSGYPLSHYISSRETITNAIKNGLMFFILEDMRLHDKKPVLLPVGYVSLREKFTHTGAELNTIAVTKSEHQKGYGFMLLRCIEKEARSLGKNKLYLYVYQRNYPAVSFYAKNGFYVVGIFESYYSHGETAILMCKEL